MILFADFSIFVAFALKYLIKPLCCTYHIWKLKKDELETPNMIILSQI